MFWVRTVLFPLCGDPPVGSKQLSCNELYGGRSTSMDGTLVTGPIFASGAQRWNMARRDVQSRKWIRPTEPYAPKCQKHPKHVKDIQALFYRSCTGNKQKVVRSNTWLPLNQPFFKHFLVRQRSGCFGVQTRIVHTRQYNATSWKSLGLRL